jgi:outer membrane protein
MPLKTFSKALAVTITSLIMTTAIADDYKIGVVNQLQLMEQSPQAAAMRAQLQKEFEPVDRELVVMQQKLKEAQDRLTKDSAIMSETERQKLERDIITQRRELQRKQDQFKEDLTFRQNEEVSKIQRDIIEAVRTVAQQNNYDIVLYDGVIHASARVNITQQVIDQLKSKAGAPAAAKPAPATAPKQ